ncbi:response regulator [Deferribacter autotrophicus]|uniref:Response regulator n=1 Tax=Deferribacter autotrophicus TaxID=500465 RepID=A0A5A8F5R7_9BACT|nr:response regulator [Deferribacter autotrophicus]KAA0258793.1 response regulator [Deferribacter autotrophicus]
MDKPYKILVVDDEEHTRLGYAEVLKLDGYEVDIAETGLEGLEKAKATKYDVIVTDLRMPEMDGLTFIENLRKFDESAKIVIITAFGTYKSYQKSRNLGVVTYLNKPVRAKDLKDAVIQVLGLNVE